MAIRATESPDSGGLDFDSNGGGTTLRYTVVTTDGETEFDIYTAALFGSFAYLNGFIRRKITVTPKGGPNVWTVTIEYGTTGVGGGDQPLGGAASDGSPPPNAEAPPSSTTPLTSGWSFSIRAPRLHFKRSRAVVASAKVGGGAAANFGGAIGVTANRKDIEGVDWPPEPAFTFTRTVAKAVVTLGYLETLAYLAGRTNNASFYGFDTECVILLEANGQFTQGEGWSITFTFGVNLADNPIDDIIPGVLPDPGDDPINKAGWHYLDVLYAEGDEGAERVLKPSALFVHQVVRPAPFGQLEIGE